MPAVSRDTCSETVRPSPTRCNAAGGMQIDTESLDHMIKGNKQSGRATDRNAINWPS